MPSTGSSSDKKNVIICTRVSDSDWLSVVRRTPVSPATCNRCNATVYVDRRNREVIAEEHMEIICTHCAPGLSGSESEFGGVLMGGKKYKDCTGGVVN